MNQVRDIMSVRYIYICDILASKSYNPVMHTVGICYSTAVTCVDRDSFNWETALENTLLFQKWSRIVGCNCNMLCCLGCDNRIRCINCYIRRRLRIGMFIKQLAKDKSNIEMAVVPRKKQNRYIQQ